MRLRQKNGRLEPPVFAFAHHPLYVLVRDLQVIEQHPFKLVATIRVLGHLPNPVQRQCRVPVSDRIAKRRRPSEVSMGELVNLAHA